MRSAILAFFAIGLAACTTISPEERRVIDQDSCRSYGFRPGTDAFAGCLQRIELDRRADARANRAEFNRLASRPTVIYQPVYVPVRRERQ